MLDQLVDSFSLIVNQTKANLGFLCKMLALLWGIFFLNGLMGQHLLLLGIRPRRLSGLPGILFAPFLHANFNHIFFNSIPLVVLANFILIQGVFYFLFVSFFIILVSGTLIWCFAKPGLHVGASAVITGYWGFLVSNIYHQGSLTAIILGIVCIYYFAGIFLSIFPGEKSISWQGHLFGLLSGLFLSFILQSNILI